MSSGRISAVALIAGFGLALAAATGLTLVIRRAGTTPTVPADAAESPAPTLPPVASKDSGSPESPTRQDPGVARTIPKPSREDADAGDPRRQNVVPTPESLEKTIHGRGSVKEKAVALKLAFRSRIDPTLKAFSEILTEAGMEADLQISAIRILSKGAEADPKARGLLEAFASSHSSSDPGRDLALAAVLQTGTAADLARCSELVFREHNADSVACASRALTGNRSDAARALLLAISNNHPDPDARHRAEEERTGDYCPDHAPPPENKDE